MKNIDVVILCGGQGTRLYPLTVDIPKPMVKIGAFPVVEHQIKLFEYYGFRNFKLLIGCKGEIICNYFRDRYKKLNIECIDTGLENDTAERLWQVRDKITDIFILAYADVLANIDIQAMMADHVKIGLVGTMGIVLLRTSYGVVELNGDNIAANYIEKPIFYDKWINAGFFIFNKKLFEYWDCSNKDFSRGMLVNLSNLKLLCCYKHYGFWSGMDTVRENEILNELWEKGEAEWAVWRR